MIKIYKQMLLGAILIGGVQAAMADVTVKLNINDATGVTVTANYEKVDIVSGENTINVRTYNSLSIATNDDYVLESVTKDGMVNSSWSGRSDMYFYTDNVTAEVNVLSRKLADVRTGSFTLNIDDPSKASCSMISTYLPIPELQKGANTVHFIPGVETAISISSNTYMLPFYQVKRDGEEITSTTGNY